MDTTRDLDAWRKDSLASWQDSRIVDAEWVDAHIWFFLHSYSDLANVELVLDGFSFREKHGDWLLVLKVHQGETPLVGFVTSRNPTRCMRKARKLLREGTLSWIQDKFR